MNVRLVVLASGGGSNLQALIDASEHGQLHAHIAGVVSNNAGAFALQRARDHGIVTALVTPKHDEDRRVYDARLAEQVWSWRPDWVILAGFMRILSTTFLARFPDQVINLHPALPGELPGTQAIQRAFNEFRLGKRSTTGVMVHFVSDEGIDNGRVIATEHVPIHITDTMQSLEARIHDVEHRLLVESLNTLITATQKEPAT